MCPRLKKTRRCGCRVANGIYKPSGKKAATLQTVDIMSDELEAMRLCDALGLTQAEAGRQMGISRGTVQRILCSARQKVADALSECKAIKFRQ